MSADKWSICPQCMQTTLKQKEKQVKETTEKYGKVSVEEYKKLLQYSIEPVNLEPTMREDYELGIDEDGSFDITYSAYCDQCKFSFEFNHISNVI